MTAPISQSVYVANVIAVATSRGITDSEHLARIRLEAIDFWESSMNQSFSGSPRGSTAAN